MAVLGIDTSCYTTSVALYCAQRGALYQNRKLLEVKKGGLGLRQQEAFFQHIQALPQLLCGAFSYLREQGDGIDRICVSNAPRTVAGSYMPVFRAGVSMAESLGTALDVPVSYCSHQQGHVLAAEIGIQALPKEYLALHLSGGTTELIRVKQPECTVEILGGTTDISCGQLIDRIGVALGMKFPCGKEMEERSRERSADREALPVSVRGLEVSFSGCETECKRRLAQGTEPEALIVSIFECIGMSIGKMVTNAARETGLKTVLLCGGVSGNACVFQTAQRFLEKKCPEAVLLVAQREYSSDNAMGVARYGAKEGYGIDPRAD